MSYTPSPQVCELVQIRDGHIVFAPADGVGYLVPVDAVRLPSSNPSTAIIETQADANERALSSIRFYIEHAKPGVVADALNINYLASLLGRVLVRIGVMREASCTGPELCNVATAYLDSPLRPSLLCAIREIVAMQLGNQNDTVNLIVAAIFEDFGRAVPRPQAATDIDGILGRLQRWIDSDKNWGSQERWESLRDASATITALRAEHDEMVRLFHARQGGPWQADKDKDSGKVIDRG